MEMYCRNTSITIIKHIEYKPNKNKHIIKLSRDEEKANKYLTQFWREYPKIANLMQTMFIKEFNESDNTKDDVIWVGSEKVHSGYSRYSQLHIC